MFRRRAPRHGFTATVPTARPAAHPSNAGHPAAAGPAAGAAAGPAAGRDPGGPPPAGLDVSTAHPARVWNYWLGGRDFFAADRAAGDHLNREFPHLAEMARAERAFLVRAVRYLAGPARIRQFLDIGAGLPTASNVHQVAQSIVPQARVAYVDNDPIVAAHAQALLSGDPAGREPAGQELAGAWL
ncbi:MAG TPA: SAM-dependent methyltransferase, partial [Streptosporangiaceae bacterium]|nr:SAM-dependent methyltransferase [Streptosporangiaceae bacterium]